MGSLEVGTEDGKAPCRCQGCVHSREAQQGGGHRGQSRLRRPGSHLMRQVRAPPASTRTQARARVRGPRRAAHLCGKQGRHESRW